MTKVCLTMIVRDEAANIKRVLESAKPWIDYVVIVDTGSVDGTPALVEEFLLDFPGELHHRPWVDFAQARTEAVAFARGRADYILMLDADWELDFDGDDGWGQLTEDSYLCRAEHADGATHLMKLLLRDRLDLNWHYTGPVHEFALAEGEKRGGLHPTAKIMIKSVGAVNKNRLRKDVAVMTPRLRKAQGRDRAHILLHLGNTYFSLREPVSARKYYIQLLHIPLAEDNLVLREQQYHARYQLFKLAESDRERMEHLSAAQQLIPYRAEALYPLLKFLRAHGRAQTAFELADNFLSRRGVAPPLLMFHLPYLYKWGILGEYALAAIATGRDDEAETALNRLATLDVPEDKRMELVSEAESILASRSSQPA